MAESNIPLQRWATSYQQGQLQELDELARVVEHTAPTLPAVWPAGTRRVVLAGIGASYAALASPLHQLRRAGLDIYRTDCSDLPQVPNDAPDLVIALSQSGRSTETCEVLGRFVDARADTLAIVNATNSPLSDLAARSVTLGGRDDSRVSTTGFVITYATLAMLADVATSGAVHPGWSVLPAVIDQARERAADTLTRFAEDHLQTGSADLVATAAQLTAAEAVALLFREGPLVPSAAHGTRSYLHGPMDSAGPGSAHLLIGGRREVQLAEQLAERTDAILGIVDDDLRLPAGLPTIPVATGLTSSQRALVEVCILQQLVAATAKVRGTPVDDTVFTRQDTKL